MRKIEKEMIQACVNGTNWHKDNTQVLCKNNEVYVFLHDNHIASFVDGMLKVNLKTLRKWPSMTTRSRLRALGANLVSIKGTLHLDGKSIYAE